MRICLAAVGNPSWVGGNHYTYNLIRALSASPERHEHEVVLLTQDANESVMGVDRIHRISFLDRMVLKLQRELGRTLRLFTTDGLRPGGIDFLYPDFAGARYPHPWAAWIPDFQHRHMPALFSPQEIEARESRHAAMATNAPAVVLSSRMAADDFARFYPAAAAKARVMPFASWIDPTWHQDDAVAVQRAHGLPDRFLLVCNQFWQHKGHRMLFDAMDRLHAAGRPVTVAFTGATEDFRDPSYFPRLKARIDASPIRERVHILGMVPRRDQVQLMRRAVALVQPSTFEGWSTVVEEARGLGKPVVVSDFPVHREQDAPGSLFFPVGDAASLAERIGEAWDRFAPGPDGAAEAASLADNRTRMATFGGSILELARSLQCG
jgi:glycosyltransferase involved in cell wall biosynthesis